MKHPLYTRPRFATVRELVEYLDTAYGARIAYTYRVDPHDKETQVRSFARLAADVRAIAEALHARGIPSAPSALIGRLSYGWVCIYLALLSAGGTVVPLDPDWGEEELAATAAAADCKTLFCSDDILEKAIGIERVVSMDSEKAALSLDSLAAEGQRLREGGADAYGKTRIRPDELSLLVFTSGTTGKGKGVMLTQTAILTNITSGLQLVDAGDRTIGLLPPHHTFGSTVGILGNLLLGANMYISSGTRYLVREMKEHRPTHLILVPLYLETFYRRIKAAIRESGRESMFGALSRVSDLLARLGIDARKRLFASVRATFGGELSLVVSGGAPLSEEIAAAFVSLGIRVLNGYGITECAPLISVNRPAVQKKGSVGMVIPTAQVRIKDADENGEGEICVKGPSVMLGYYKDPEATEAAFDENGYFRTGDIGRLDADGWVYVTGRVKNLIILSNGKNVYPEEIETALCAVPGVIDVVVYEGVSRRGEETGVIACEIYPDSDFLQKNGIEDKQAYFKQFITEYNRTAVPYKKVGVLKVRETEFPKNTLRKITRFTIDRTVE